MTRGPESGWKWAISSVPEGMARSRGRNVGLCSDPCRALGAELGGGWRGAQVSPREAGSVGEWQTCTATPGLPGESQAVAGTSPEPWYHLRGRTEPPEGLERGSLLSSQHPPVHITSLPSASFTGAGIQPGVPPRGVGPAWQRAKRGTGWFPVSELSSSVTAVLTTSFWLTFPPHSEQNSGAASSRE